MDIVPATTGNRGARVCTADLGGTRSRSVWRAARTRGYPAVVGKADVPSANEMIAPASRCWRSPRSRGGSRTRPTQPVPGGVDLTQRQRHPAHPHHPRRARSRSTMQHPQQPHANRSMLRPAAALACLLIANPGAAMDPAANASLAAADAAGITEQRIDDTAQQALAVTIYNDDLALVKDLRQLTLVQGENRLAWRNVLRPDPPRDRAPHRGHRRAQGHAAGAELRLRPAHPAEPAQEIHRPPGPGHPHRRRRHPHHGGRHGARHQ